MILADTSVWIDHFRRGNPRLEALLDERAIVIHADVIGEPACGTLPTATSGTGSGEPLRRLSCAGVEGPSNQCFRLGLYVQLLLRDGNLL